MVGTVKIGIPLFLGLRCNAWLIHSWRPWEGCLMSEFLQQEVEDHIVGMKKIIGRNLVMRIRVSAVNFIASVKAVEDVVVDTVLIWIISVVAVELMVAGCILKMKSSKIKIKTKGLLMMGILSRMAEGLPDVIIIGVLILKIGDIIVVAVIMTTQIALLESS
jgi:hypothetical protein